MDKITFESVMEEIKKSLGEARLMKIGEESVADTQAKIQNDIDARNAARDATNRQKVDDADAATTPARGTSTSTPAPAPVPAPATRSATPTPAPAPAARPSLPSMTAQGPKLGSSNFQGSNTPEKPTPAPAPAPQVKSGVGGGLGFGINGGKKDGVTVAPSTPLSGAKPPVPKSQGYSDITNQPVAPKTQGITNQPLKSQGVTNQAATSGGNKYGFKDSGSDDDTAANFFAADKRMMADRAAQSAPAKPSAPKPSAPKRAAPMPPRRPVAGGSAGNVTSLAENFDQFVKKFLKESK